MSFAIRSCMSAGSRAQLEFHQQAMQLHYMGRCRLVPAGKALRWLTLLQRAVHPSLDVGEELDRRLEKCLLLLGQIDAQNA